MDWFTDTVSWGLKLLALVPLIIAIVKAARAVWNGISLVQACTLNGGVMTDAQVTKYLTECNRVAAAGSSLALSEFERLYLGRISRIISPINSQISNVVLWGLFATIGGLTVSLFQLSSVLSSAASEGVTEKMGPVLLAFGIAFIGSGLGVISSICLQFFLKSKVVPIANEGLEQHMDTIRRSFVASTDQALVRTAEQTAQLLKASMSEMILTFKEEMKSSSAVLAEHSASLAASLTTFNQGLMSKIDTGMMDAFTQLKAGSDVLAHALDSVKQASSKLSGALEKETEHTLRLVSAADQISQSVGVLSQATEAVDRATQSSAVRKFAESVAAMTRSVAQLDEAAGQLAARAQQTEAATNEVRQFIAKGVIQRDETFDELKQHIQHLGTILATVQTALNDAGLQNQQAARISLDAEHSLERLTLYAESFASIKADEAALKHEERQLLPAISFAISEIRTSAASLSQTAAQLAQQLRQMQMESNSFNRFPSPDSPYSSQTYSPPPKKEKQSFWGSLLSKLRRKP